MNKKFILGTGAVIAVFLGIFAAIFMASKANPEVKTQYLQPFPELREVADFVLKDQRGQEFLKQDLQGYWNLVFIGYTYCPDVCPTTLASLNQIYPQLSQLDASAPIRVIFISVDPNRDTKERLFEYINYFNHDFLALTGPHAELFPLTRSLGLMYAISEGTDNPNYLVDHSASIVVINPQGKAVGRFKPNYQVGEVPVSDSQQILADMPYIVSNP
jgi:protein SCO1/2